ncbi:MAG: phage tail length tape measure family protein [Cypionkella sp.]
MTLKAAVLVTANATQAKAELRALQGEAGKTAASTTKLGTTAHQASTELSLEAQRAAALAAELERLKAEQDAVNARNEKLKTSAKGAGGSVANLAAQFNDVGMMIAAGQSPMQMAIQQGTQITQVIGPMGAAGAARALGTAFMSLLNPVNFATYAVLAGGAALIQWAMGAGDTGEAAKTTEDRIKDLDGAVAAYSASAKNAMKPTSELAKEYGNLAGKAKEAFKAIAEADRQSALAALKDSQAALSATFGGFDMGTEGLAGSPLEDTLLRIRTELGATGEQAVKIQQTFRDLANAEGPVQIATAAQAAREALIAAGVAANAPLVEGLNAAQSKAFELQATTDAIAASTYSIRDAANSAAAAMAGIGGAAAGAYGAVAALAAKAWEAAGARMAATQKYTTPDASGRLVDKATLYAPMKGRGVSPIVPKSEDYKLADDWNKPVKATGGGRSASADAATKEKEAVAELIKKLQDEQAILRESDPVKQEMLKHRKELAGASETERQKIEELIRAEMQLKSVREATDFMATTSLDALRGIVAGGDEASASMKKLANSILDAALQALWLGKGPLAGLFGITGNIFSGIFGGGKGIAAKADGGMTFGEGSGRADKNLTWLSAGEFTVNARATARYRPLLERINNGLSIPGFANGGMNGRAAQISAEGGSPAKVEQHIHVYGATGNAEIHDMVADGVKSGLELYNREVLPSRVKGIMQKPRMSGG